MFRPHVVIFRHFSCKDPHALCTDQIFVLCFSYLILVCSNLYLAGASFSCVHVLGVPCVLRVCVCVYVCMNFHHHWWSLSVLWHRGRFYNNRGMSVNILSNEYRQQQKNCRLYAAAGKHSPLRLWQQYRGNCFLCGLRQANAQNNRTSIARQQSCKHASLTEEDGIFHGGHAEELSWRPSALWVSQFSVGDSHGKFVVEEELEIVLWRLNMWFEGFKLKTKLRGFSPQANYTDRATSACRRS
jgi:hypothetical protein